MKKRLPLIISVAIISLSVLLMTSCSKADFYQLKKKFMSPAKPIPRLAMFVGVDISGSFQNGPYYNDSLRFLAHYIYAHLHGLGGLDPLASLFVGSIGGQHKEEMKTFYPIQVFEGKSVDQIEDKLHSMFPRHIKNPYTDFNAFFRQVAHTAKTKKLMLKPISLVLISDGVPDAPDVKEEYRNLDLKPLDSLSRSVTIRLLYTSAVVGANWQRKVPRTRVRIWTQDAQVMVYWKDPSVMKRGVSFYDQPKYFAWVQDNVDFGVRSVKVN